MRIGGVIQRRAMVAHHPLVDAVILGLLLTWTEDAYQDADPQDSNCPNCFPRLICDGIGGTGMEQETARETEENGGPGVKRDAKDLRVVSGG